MEPWISAASALFHGWVQLLAAGVLACILFFSGCEENPSGKEEPMSSEGKACPLPRSWKKLRSVWESENTTDLPVVEFLAVMCENAYLAPEEAEKAFLALGVEAVHPVAAESIVA